MPKKIPTVSTFKRNSITEFYEQTEERRADKAFYNGKPWRQLRLQKLLKDPLCEHCLKKERIEIAIDVDHIVDRKIAPHLEYEYTNLQSLCKSCHSSKTHSTKVK